MNEDHKLNLLKSVVTSTPYGKGVGSMLDMLNSVISPIGNLNNNVINEKKLLPRPIQRISAPRLSGQQTGLPVLNSKNYLAEYRSSIKHTATQSPFPRLEIIESDDDDEVISKIVKLDDKNVVKSLKKKEVCEPHTVKIPHKRGVTKSEHKVSESVEELVSEVVEIEDKVGKSKNEPNEVKKLRKTEVHVLRPEKISVKEGPSASNEELNKNKKSVESISRHKSELRTVKRNKKISLPPTKQTFQKENEPSIEVIETPERVLRKSRRVKNELSSLRSKESKSNERLLQQVLCVKVRKLDVKEIESPISTITADTGVDKHRVHSLLKRKISLSPTEKQTKKEEKSINCLDKTSKKRGIAHKDVKNKVRLLTKRQIDLQKAMKTGAQKDVPVEEAVKADSAQLNRNNMLVNKTQNISDSVEIIEVHNNNNSVNDVKKKYTLDNSQKPVHHNTILHSVGNKVETVEGDKGNLEHPNLKIQRKRLLTKMIPKDENVLVTECNAWKALQEAQEQGSQLREADETSSNQKCFSAFEEAIFHKHQGVAIATCVSVANFTAGYIEIDRRRLFSGKTTSLLFHVLEGEPEVTINETTKRVKHGTFLYIPPGASYQIKNSCSKRVCLSYTKVAT